MLNVRIYRVAPSRNGHVGYTRQGFYLNEDEATALRDALSDMLLQPELFEPVDDTLKEVSDTLVGDGE